VRPAQPRDAFLPAVRFAAVLPALAFALVLLLTEVVPRKIADELQLPPGVELLPPRSAELLPQSNVVIRLLLRPSVEVVSPRPCAALPVPRLVAPVLLLAVVPQSRLYFESTRALSAAGFLLQPTAPLRLQTAVAFLQRQLTVPQPPEPD